MNHLMMLLADEPNRGPDYGKASPIGLLVVVLLLIALFGLVWSMNRHLKKVPASFDAAPAETAPASEAQTPPTDAPAPESEVPPRESGG